MLKGRLQKFGKCADAWFRIDQAMRNRQGAVAISRVDAHVDVKDVISTGSDLADWLGNELADHLAGEAAERNLVSLNMSEGYGFLVGRARKIIKRAMATHRLFLEAPGSESKIRGIRIKQEHPVHAAIRQSGHKIVRDERGAFQCTRCAQRVGHRKLKEWLLGGRCKGLKEMGGSWDAGLAPGGTVVQIAGATSHPTHALAWKRGVWFCCSCGSYAKAAIDEMSGCKNLRKACPGHCSRHGERVLKRIEAGLPPKQGMAWPLDRHNPKLKEQTLDEIWPDRREGPRSKKARIERVPGPTSAQEGVSVPLEQAAVAEVSVPSSPFKRARTEKYGQGLEEKKEDHGVDVSDFEDEDPWDVSIHQGIDEG